MDHHRFDHWARSWHERRSRRAVTKVVAGGALAAVLAQFGWGDAEAKCVAPGKRCKSKNGKAKQCCGGAKCRGTKCKCPGGRRQCGKTCCRKGQTCTGGKCVGTCPPGSERCPRPDGSHKCCAEGEVCAGDGVCVVGQGTCASGADFCSTGFIFCNSSLVCICAQRLQGGTRCVQPTVVSDADQCASDNDCVGLGFPVGSSCIRDEGEVECGGSDPDRGMCMVPCGFVPASTAAAALDRLLAPKEK